MAANDPEQAKRVFQAVVLTVLADSEPDAKEAAVVAKIRQDFPELGGLPDIQGIGREVRVKFEGLGLEETAREVAGGIVDREYRELAFVCAARVMQADGETDLEEAELLGIFQELFAFSGDDVKRLLAQSQRK